MQQYAKLYKGAVSESLCEHTVHAMGTINFQKHNFYNATTGETKPRDEDKELSMSWDNVPTKNQLNKIVDDTASQYVKDLNMPWFSEYQGYSHVRFNKYEKSKEMALHCDHIHSMFDGERKGVPILSVLGLLNDDFEGGEFFMIDKQREFSKGDILIFPSNFIYPHVVKPVTKGIRYSFISWIW